MHFIGITGGVGAGKSTVLNILRDICKDKCEIIEADRLAEELMSPGYECYEKVVALDWPESILVMSEMDVNNVDSEDCGSEICVGGAQIDRRKMAQYMYADVSLLQAVNDIVHPACKVEILRRVDRAREEGKLDYFFLEAALLIECGYKEVCDELWYIYADEDIRRERLKASRGYSDEKVDSIMAKQLSEDVFKAKCDRLIDNSTDEVMTRKQVLELLGSLE